MKLKLIKNAIGLRQNNFIFVDNMVIPPNFITAKPMRVGDDLETLFNEDTNNCAYLNISKKYIVEVFGENDDGEFVLDGFVIKPILIPEPFDFEYPIWEISFNEHHAKISFFHELQNYYFDWTGKELVPLN